MTGVQTCALPICAFTLIANAVAGSPYTDTTVSGTLTFAYQVTGLDATGRCESGPSACVQATLPNVLFSDGFESGTLGAWSGSTP